MFAMCVQKLTQKMHPQEASLQLGEGGKEK
jgi:hypothetical protein